MTGTRKEEKELRGFTYRADWETRESRETISSRDESYAGSCRGSQNEKKE